MKTVSINVMNLCVPCENRCRYCLLSYSGKTTGVDFERSRNYAQRFYDWLKTNRPELSFLFGFGYSMEHPELLDAIRFCQSIGSATGEFLQFDGMRFRTEPELEALIRELKESGIKLIDLTFYGTEDYHDSFAARKGDFLLMMDTLKVANKIGLDVTVSIPVTRENARHLDALLDQLRAYRVVRTSCFVPHCEGRGQLQEDIRLTADEYDNLSEQVKQRFNRARFRAEGEWLAQENLPEASRRVLTVTLTPDNIAFFEQMDFASTIEWLEKMDDTYYRTVPGLQQLMQLYGDPKGRKMYSLRDLYMHYQKRYIAEQNIRIYDVNDERQCFSRRI